MIVLLLIQPSTFVDGKYDVVATYSGGANSYHLGQSDRAAHFLWTHYVSTNPEVLVELG